MAKKGQRDEVDKLSPQEQSALRLHLTRLKLADEDEYRAWCAERNLSTKLLKPESRRRKEVELRENEDVQKAIARDRAARKDPRQMLDRIFDDNAECGQLTAL
jgi:hypothetical protein